MKKVSDLEMGGPSVTSKVKEDPQGLADSEIVSNLTGSEVQPPWAANVAHHRHCCLLLIR